MNVDHAVMRREGRWAGWSLIETLVVLALLAAVLVAGAWWSLRDPSAAAIAQELARVATTVRWSAVSEGVPVLMLSAGPDPVLRSLRGRYACQADTEDTRLVWTAPARSSIGWPAMGLAFAPDGRPRRCDASAVGNTTILIEGPRGDRAAVIVASLGRVRWERR